MYFHVHTQNHPLLGHIILHFRGKGTGSGRQRDGFCLQSRVLNQAPRPVPGCGHLASAACLLSSPVCSCSPGQRHPAGDVPGQPRALARLLLCVQPLPVLRLLPGGPARHPPLPAAAAAHPSAGPAQRLSRRRLAGGGPSVPEDHWYLMSRAPSPRKLYRKSHFRLRVSPLHSHLVLFFFSLFVPGNKTKPHCSQIPLSWKCCVQLFYVQL